MELPNYDRWKLASPPEGYPEMDEDDRYDMLLRVLKAEAKRYFPDSMDRQIFIENFINRITQDEGVCDRLCESYASEIEEVWAEECEERNDPNNYERGD